MIEIMVKNLIGKIIGGKACKFLNLLRHVQRAGIQNCYWLIKTIELDYGHYLSSKKGMSINKDGEYLPWYTYPAIEYLHQFDYSEKDVFEYGAGSSSLFWAKRARTVKSVEHDKAWFEKISRVKIDNLSIYYYADKEAYVNAISSSCKRYDIVIIDAVWRLECAKKAIQSLKPGGMILLDNSNWYLTTSKFLREAGFIEIDFHGLGPVVYNQTWTTSLFMHREITLKPIFDAQPQNAIGGLKKVITQE